MYCEHCEIELAEWNIHHQILEADPDAGYRSGIIDYNSCPDCGTELYY